MHAILNPMQQQAVEAVDGPVLVLAGPGSGKTRVLTYRVAHLIDQVGIEPSRILAVTFTNKAARQLNERLTELIGTAETGALTIGTFHSLCSRFLRRDVVHLGRERDFAIYDSDDQQRLMQRVLRDLNLDEKKHPARAILNRISSAKNELVGPAEFARINRASPYDKAVADCYAHYQKLLHESNAFDFDDLLSEMVRLLHEQPAVLEHYQQRYQYLMVDEYQDTNRAQYMLVKLLAATHRNLFVVGDNDQSIYGWRGADVRNILDFQKDYPEARVILLEQNYRSTQAILDVGQAVIDASPQQRYRKQLHTSNSAGSPVVLRENADQTEEAINVVDELSRLIGSGSYQARDCAVMYRTNAQSRALEEALIIRGMRYQLIGGIRFYERKEVKDVLAALRLALNPNDRVSLDRLFQLIGRGIGDRTTLELNRWANEMGIPVSLALQQIVAYEADSNSTAEKPAPMLRPAARKALVRFFQQIQPLLQRRRQYNVLELLALVLEQLHFKEVLLNEYGTDDGLDRWNNVLELYNVAQEYTHLPQESQLATFLEEIALFADLDKLDADADAITCITLHQAKGLEYPIVFLIGLEDGLLPHNRSIDTPDQLEEERRLLYVGITRAKERLYLYYTRYRSSYGRLEASRPSRFLADIPKDLVKRMSGRKDQTRQSQMVSSRSSGPVRSSPSGRSPSSSGSDAPSRTPVPVRRDHPTSTRQPVPMTARKLARANAGVQFQPGQRVYHDRFGEGVVLESRTIDDDEQVTVNFGEQGQRKLLVSLANLKHLT
ncbi:MAG: UvrD-helicase domain-containing protein [Chloroflexaceae bacterium]|nr:UvrD-helicase domain-containing protein [Chloroflexaceae bacterium]